ncbi:peptidylprolyl isomerase [Polymorphobacter arshaanensis]|uniref:peptidylprolyl isomerase n=1 Tax=Glacieibacterium arshaanense TaxID=2511025 RepID=A0A4Y9EKF0_9SPHN|nr:peptidylprolyl isomerase [Polymorphobacter arshaanensis]TFU01231.1 peptidylprolyl isomerase [Polymorphobacter arshaanensis]
MLWAAAPLAAQTPPPPSTVAATPAIDVATPAAPSAIAPPAPPVRKPATTNVVMTTSAGTIVIALETERAPATAANFLRYVDQKRYDGTTIYRAMKLGKDGQYGLIQGGISGNPKRALAPVAHESTAKTGLTHDDGAISMARSTPGSATGDFFIAIGAMTGLDANPAASGDNQGFAVFGHVVEGMDLVKKIQHLPTSPTLGAGVMKGQMLADPVKIISVKRAK